MAESKTPADLVEQARSGSMDALGALYDAHAAAVYGAAYRLLNSRADAEDVVQDVFVGLPRALRTYRGEGSLGGWIRQVGVRTALMRLRSRRRRDGHHTPTDGAELAAVPPTATVDRLALEDALRRLPEELRTVFVLKSAEGYSHDEISGLLDITPLASRARLARARSRLRNLLT